MTNDKLPCLKCKGDMFQGFVPDYSHGALFVASWQPGQPQKSFWTKTKRPPLEGVPIGAFACTKCGFLEFYAGPRFAAQ